MKTLLLNKLRKLTGLTLVLLASHVKASDFYWVGGAGDWSDYANHWATTSGGSVFYTYPPTLLDNVYFDNNSFSSGGQIITSASSPQCHNFSWTCTTSGNKIHPSGTNKLTIFGDFYMGANTSYSDNIGFEFQSSGVQSITVLDTISAPLNFNNAQGVWNFTAPLNSTSEVLLRSGTVNTGNYNWSLQGLSSVNGVASSFITGTSDFILISSGQFHVFGSTQWIGAGNNFTLLPTFTPADSSSFSSQIMSSNYDFFLPTSTIGNIYSYNYGKAGTYYLVSQVNFSFGDSVDFKNIYINNGEFSISGSDFNGDSIICYSSAPIGDIGMHISRCSLKCLTTNKPIYIDTYDFLYIDNIAATSNLEIVRSNGAGGDFVSKNINCAGNFKASRYLGSSWQFDLHIQNLVLNGNGTFNGGIQIDTLVLNKGTIHTIKSGDTLRVASMIKTRGAAGYLVQFISSTPGVSATLDLGQQNLCSDYLYVKDMNVLAASAYAGTNSYDGGNNSGWTFSGCSSASNVWPGDCNYDLTVDNFDLLNIGLAYGSTGAVRASASLNWVAQTADDWGGYFSWKANYKHADANGDGVVNAADTIAIVQNYGLTHPFRIANTIDNFDPDGMQIKIDLPANLTPGNTYTVPITVGNVYMSIMNLYGIGFNVMYDATQVVPGSVSVSFANSFMNSTLGNLSLVKNLIGASKLNVANTLTNHTGVNGSGVIGELTFTLISSAQNVDFFIGDVVAITPENVPIPLIGMSSSATTSLNEYPVEMSFDLYPNPAKDYCYVEYNIPGYDMSTLEIYDLSGKILMVKELSVTRNSIALPVESLRRGIYFVKLKSSYGQKVLKLVKS